MAYVTLSSKAVGSIVWLREIGVPQEYVVVLQGQPPGMLNGDAYDVSCNGTWLVRKNLHDKIQWGLSVGSGKNYNYATSNLHIYLNSTFFNLLAPDVQQLVKQVKIPYTHNSSDLRNGTASGANGLSTRVFAPSVREMGADINTWYAYDGSKIEWLNQNYRATLNGATVAYWLRTPYSTGEASRNDHVLISPTTDPYGQGSTPIYFQATRPMMILSAEAKVGDDGIVFRNTAPGTPASIHVPTSVSGGGAITISWGAAGDAEGNLAGYQLERSVNGGGWTLIYQGGALAVNDTITWGWNTVTYRVRAYDSTSAFSGYQTSAARTVFNNQAPVISGSNADLGIKTGAFSTAYTVSDANPGQAVAVVEMLDGKQKRKFNVTNSLACTFDVTAAEWRELANETHTIKITATDAAGAAVVRTLTFQKNETEIDVTAVLAKVPTEMPTKGIITVSRQIPLESNLLVEVCNNARDAAPTWQDITTAVKNGQKFFIANTKKTAAQWGVGVRVRVYRLGAAGECWISAIGGNFE